jgi:crossover junction endodeoxyribonuclease RuvC
MIVPKVTPITVLCLDPGYDRCGWAVGTVQRHTFTPIEYGCWETDRKASLSERYLQILNFLTATVLKHRPQEAAMEELFFSKNTTTALKVSETRGLILGHLLSQQVKITQYNPGTIKLAVTGNGRADKAAVQKMVQLQLHLPPQKLLDDTFDALALGITHSVSLQIPQ